MTDTTNVDQRKKIKGWQILEKKITVNVWE